MSVSRSDALTAHTAAAMLRDLLDETSELVCTADVDGRVTYANRAWLTTFGYTLDEARTLRAVDMVAAEDRERYLGVARELHRGAIVADFEATLIGADGRRVVCRGRGTPEMIDDATADGGQRCVGTRAAFRDVPAERRAESARARVEEALRESEARVRGAVEASLDALFVLRAVHDAAGAIVDFEIVDCNRQCAVFAATPRDTILGQSASLVFRDARARGLLDACVRVVETGAPYITEYRMDGAEASLTWAWLHVVRVGDGVAVTARDVSAQKASEEALRALALVDELTGVLNRRGFLAAAEREWQRAARERQGALLLYVDVNDFKGINDTLGHAEGDRALRAVGDVLRAAFRGADVIGRLGGDEFAVLVVPTGNAATPMHAPSDLAVVERMVSDRLAHHLASANGVARAAGRPYELTLSVGIARWRADDVHAATPAASLAALMVDADEHLYTQKRARKGSDIVVDARPT